MSTKKQRLEELQKVITDYGGEQVSALEVYTDIFKLGDGLLEHEGDKSGKFKTNPIGFGYNFKRDEKGKPIFHVKKDGSTADYYERDTCKHIVMYEDTFAKNLKELQKYDFAILNGLTYFGGRNYFKNANKLYALILDLDGITASGIYNLLYGGQAGMYPLPNYIVLSGTNCHLYYLMEQPIPLYPDIKAKLNDFKYSLVSWVWNKNISSEAVQYQSLNQGFRVIGGKTKPRSALRRVIAYRIHQHPYDLKTLNDFVPVGKQINDSELFRTDKMDIAEAKEKYPEWYRRISAKEKGFPGRLVDLSKQKGHRGDELYEWWLRRLRNTEAVYGSRYFAVMCLVIYAVKCNVPFERVKADAYSLIDTMTNINPAKPFTELDIRHALKAYHETFATVPRKEIERMSNIPIPKNKRNGRKQAEHLRRARAVQAIDYPDGEWRNKDGRPKGSGEKKKLVADFIAKNPTANVSEIAKALGVSRTTVYKWKE